MPIVLVASIRPHHTSRPRQSSRVSSNPLAPLARFGTKDFCDAQCDFLHKAHFHCVVEECGALFSTLDGAIKHAK